MCNRHHTPRTADAALDVKAGLLEQAGHQLRVIAGILQRCDLLVVVIANHQRQACSPGGHRKGQGQGTQQGSKLEGHGSVKF